MNYWDNRYNTGGTSGSGSYGILAQYKAGIINDFVLNNNIKKVIEFGCGDGNQLLLANYPKYIGLDTSTIAINICEKIFNHDQTKKFKYYDPTNFKTIKADLTISLDVIFHILDDALFDKYMRQLFNCSSKHIIIYSSNFDNKTYAKHIAHRKFTDWVDKNKKQFKLYETIENKYPYDPKQPNTTSFSDFYIYRKKNESKKSKSK